MSNPSLATEAAAAGSYPANRFNQRERKLLASVKEYVDSLSPDTVITTQGDVIVGNAGGNATRLAKGTSGLPLVAGASTVSYAALTDTGLASNAVTTAKITDLNVTTGKLAADAVDGTKIADAAVSLEHLDSGATYSHKVIAAGTFTTVGGDTTESIPATGALGTDLAFVQLRTPGNTPVTLVAAAATTDAITVTTSADPAADHVICWQILRAAT
jgi:hypothetical protein